MSMEQDAPQPAFGTPTEIGLDGAREHLRVTWPGGIAVEIAASLLRAHARDAASTRLALDGLAAPALDWLTIAHVEPIGNYAIRITFSDGHDRGIFPWPHLSQIAACVLQDSQCAR